MVVFTSTVINRTLSKHPTTFGLQSFDHQRRAIYNKATSGHCSGCVNRKDRDLVTNSGLDLPSMSNRGLNPGGHVMQELRNLEFEHRPRHCAK